MMRNMAANRAELIERIKSLSDDEMERVAPYIEADLDAVDDLDALYAEIAEGRKSAQTEPLLDDDAVAKSVAEHLKRQS